MSNTSGEMSGKAPNNIESRHLLPLTWPKPLRGAERLWQLVTGRERAHLLTQIAASRSNALELFQKTFAHHLNNRLSPVVGFSELQTLDSSLPARARETAQLISASANELNRSVKILEQVMPEDLDTMDPSQSIPLIDLTPASQRWAIIEARNKL